MVERIERELVLPASPREVWEVITASGWLADEVEFELVPGGEARFTTDDGARTGWVEEAVAPEDGEGAARLVFWWSEGEESATRVEVGLIAEDAVSTRLRVLEERPLELLDVVGIPLSDGQESSPGPLMLSLA
jgi:uncharacterized protein YndB with AHSA1/START domain